MARTNNLTNFLTDVATAIKTKKGDSTPIPASNFDTEITNLPSGGDENAIVDINNYAAGGSYLYEYITKLPPLDASQTQYPTNLSNTYRGLKRLQEVNITNTGNVTNFGYMFYNCSALKNVPILNMSSATNVYLMFSGCGYNMTNESLDNILQSCISATSYSGTKTLSQMGFSRNYVNVSKWQNLPHYEDFINAGWTIGYN